MAKNGLLTKEAGKILADMLKENSVLKELDLSESGYRMPSSKKDGPGFAQEFADGMKNNGAMTTVNMMGNHIGKEQLDQAAAVPLRQQL